MVALSTFSVPGLYVDFSIPFGLYALVQNVISNNQGDPNVPQVVMPPANRVWFSQPRPGADSTVEVVTINFKLPLSVSEVGWDALRVSSHTEVWYQDRLSNWRQVLDEARNPVALEMSTSGTAAWYTAHFYCYPIVAKKVQFRINRVYDSVVGTQPYVVGIRNGLIRRNVYRRADGTMGIEPQQDAIGNTFTSYLKDWDATKSFDNDPNTYWKSMPMPDPAAVVALYLDLRTPDGGPQLVDTLYLDPVYTGNVLNLYYSNDDTVDVRKLSPITAVPSSDENTQWQAGRGRWDTSDLSGTSSYAFPMSWGPLVSQDTWIGIEWIPDFSPVLSNAVQEIVIIGNPTGGTFTLSYAGQTTIPLNFNASAADVAEALIALTAIGTGNVSVTGHPGGPWDVTFQNALGGMAIVTLGCTSALIGGVNPGVVVNPLITGGVGGTPPTNPVLFTVTPTTPAANQYWPTIYYDTGAGEIVLELTNGTTTQTWNVALSPPFVQNRPLRIVAGWGYDPPTVLLSVVTDTGAVLGQTTVSVDTLPSLTTLDGTIGFTNFRGLFTAHIIKLENYSLGQAAFQANAQIYVSPDPVYPDAMGNVPATTLDNAIYAAAWVMQEHGTGGSHETHFEDKTWTPIWVNYTTFKGKLYFPQQINMKFLKCEFTALTEEPYPVYDSGIAVSYEVFPISVTAPTTVQVAGDETMLSVGNLTALSGTLSVNWLNATTVNNAVNSVYGQTVPPATVTSGPGVNTSTLPNTSALDLSNQTRQEVSTPWVFKRSPPSAPILAAQYVGVVRNGGNLYALGAYAALTWTSITAEVSTLNVNSQGGAYNTWFGYLGLGTDPTALPSIGNDWWVFPGATLQMDANTMTSLTRGSVTVSRINFKGTLQMRFATTSVHRYDIRTVTRDSAVAYFAGVREIQPLVTTYIASQDPEIFTFSSYDPSQWVLTNVRALSSGPISTSGSLYEIVNSQFDTDVSNWEQTQGVWIWDGTLGHWYLGTATVTADGTQKVLTSTPIDVAPGAHVDASVWVHWEGLVAAASTEAIQLQALYYNGNTYVSTATAGISYTAWPATTPITAGNPWQQIQATAATFTGFTIPAGVTSMRLALVVTTDVSAGRVWFDTVVTGTTDTIEATVFKDFQTQSTFVKVNCAFTDSGLLRSDDMWAQADPLDVHISSTALAYYTTTYPDKIPSGMWADTFATWTDTVISWGEPQAVVEISVDPDRIFQGKRVLHFFRAAGAGEAGIKVRQVTNWIPNGLFRLGCIFYKPYANTNQLIIRLRRISDGVYIYTETFDPIAGFWYEFQTSFIEIPDSEDQAYTVELMLTGDETDELYLNDLYCDIAQIRYFVRLGDSSAFLHDVTPLRYADSAIVSCTDPVSEFSVQAAILSPHSWAYSASFQPVYLK